MAFDPDDPAHPHLTAGLFAIAIILLLMNFSLFVLLHLHAPPMVSSVNGPTPMTTPVP